MSDGSHHRCTPVVGGHFRNVEIDDPIGDAPAVAAAVDGFYERVPADPDLAGYFSGVDIATLKSDQRSFIRRPRPLLRDE